MLKEAFEVMFWPRELRVESCDEDIYIEVGTSADILARWKKN